MALIITDTNTYIKIQRDESYVNVNGLYLGMTEYEDAIERDKEKDRIDNIQKIKELIELSYSSVDDESLKSFNMFILDNFKKLFYQVVTDPSIIDIYGNDYIDELYQYLKEFNLDGFDINYMSDPIRIASEFTIWVDSEHQEDFTTDSFYKKFNIFAKNIPLEYSNDD